LQTRRNAYENNHQKTAKSEGKGGGGIGTYREEGIAIDEALVAMAEEDPRRNGPLLFDSSFVFVQVKFV
jgi:hypothetical protein